MSYQDTYSDKHPVVGGIKPQHHTVGIFHKVASSLAPSTYGTAGRVRVMARKVNPPSEGMQRGRKS
jgi:hypothetical protein